MGNIEESIDKLWDFSRKLCGEDRLDIRHRIDELEAENERLRKPCAVCNRGVENVLSENTCLACELEAEVERLRKVRAAQCKVVAVLGTIWLHFGEVRCELSVSQANELADHLQNAADISGMIPQTEDE